MTRVIVLGTGRCGTHSMIELLRANGLDAVHERFEHICWDRSPWPDFHLSRSTDHWADAGFYYLPYVHDIASRYPDVKFVCLRRKRQEVVDSFINHMPTGCNWFQEGGPKDHWFDKFPTFPSTYTLEEAIGAYWDMYNTVTLRLLDFIETLEIFDTESLNDKGGVKCILDWVGIPRKDQVIETGIRADQKRPATNQCATVDEWDPWPRPW